MWTRGAERQIMPTPSHVETTQTLHRHHSETTQIHRQHTESVWSETRINHIIPAWNGASSSWVSNGGTSAGYGQYAATPHTPQHTPQQTPYQVDPLDQRMLAHQSQNRLANFRGFFVQKKFQFATNKPFKDHLFWYRGDKITVIAVPRWSRYIRVPDAMLWPLFPDRVLCQRAASTCSLNLHST